MSVGAFEDPALYRLADYGSFGKDNARIGGEEQSGKFDDRAGIECTTCNPIFTHPSGAGIERSQQIPDLS